VPVKPASGTLVLEGPQVFGGSGLTFRRWSHVRFLGDAALSRIVLANRAPIQ
jgi:hypothetical protein